MTAPPKVPASGEGAPFSAPFPVRSIADVRKLEAAPLEATLRARSTYDIFVNAARAFGDKTALTFLRTGDPADTPIRWSYAQLLEGIHQTANLLHALGVGADDAVAVLLPGCLEYHLALWGGEAAGIVQPLNPLLADAKLVSMMNASRAKVLIAYGSDDESGIWSQALRLRPLVPTLTAILRVAPHDEAPDVTAGLVAGDGIESFNLLRARQPAGHLVSGRRIAPTDIAAYFHTGGTTGAPKLAMHSHRNQLFTAWASVVMQGTAASDVTINGFPLFHVAGVLPGSLTALSAGAEIVIPTTALMRNRDVLRNYWRLVEKYRATTLAAVPTMLAALANVPVGDADISSVKYCRTGAAPLTAELAERFERLFGLHVHESFGMTEMAGISSITPCGVLAPVGCVGFPLPYAQVRIVALNEQGGASDQDMPAGEPGMVLFKSPNVFPGFVEPQDTANAFTADGWLATGDLGWMDAQGRLHLTGRSKDLIIRSGHNIDPKLIEDALGAHPAVQMCAAVGAPDAYAGELPVVFATLVPGASATEQELLDFMSARVADAAARPKRVTIIPSMPVTNVGKLYKPELRAMATVAVVAALLDEVLTGMGSAHAPRPHVYIANDGVVTVVPEMTGDDAANDRLHEALRAALARLPVKTRV
ncbi:long-chain fatty acid--CoA ligase [Pandoraea terrae]|uniref:Long-chain fatty acid--CoA ligase n=1 Tax=Pandoraea terrae TaxID=1537710 RepID=A0A5E4S3V9_9BURK|nr:acyl-CoA synthetase [Pandoraea terrae]VVD70280.1 long-chain fatty acid--CoA ligase [Pandoraea terrae]